MTTLNEVWLPIPGFEGLYDISNFGRVYSHHGKGRLMKPGDSKGYLIVLLSKDNTMVGKKPHRLVAELFVPGYFEGAHVNHIDEDKHNNHFSNLEWVTIAENNAHSKSKNWIINDDGVVVTNLAKFCRENNLDRSAMIRVADSKQKAHKGYTCRRIP